MSIRRWSKIFTLGGPYTQGIFDGPVSITEKVDGSQFNFGMCQKEGLKFLTKGSTCHIEEEDKELIKEKLWNAFSKDLKRAAVRGFPEAYKVFLVERMSNPEAQIKMDITPNQFTEVMNAAP